MLSLYFSDREKPVHVALSQDSHEQMTNFIESGRTWEGFAELETYYGQSLWLNTKKLQFVRFLEESFVPIFNASSLKESPYRQIEPEQNETLGDIRFILRVWLSGREVPIQCLEVSGFEWVDLTCACQGVNCPFRVTDEEEGLDFAARPDGVDMFLGTEPDRYDSDQLRALESEIR